jgi:branched-chain amino acid transport system ATP-binding protein
MERAVTEIVVCSDLTAGYGGIPVLRGLDLVLREGEVVAMLGANGAGKTTGLMSIVGLLRPMGGNVSFAGRPVRSGQTHRLAREGLSLVPDDRSVFFGLTVRENLRLARHARGVDATAIALDYFPALEPKMSVRAGTLSGGEQQMLAIGRALACRPRVLLVDEMSLGLAPVIVKRLLPVMRRISTDLGTAILIVEQHVDLALQFSDRAYVLSRGEVINQGKSADLLQQRHLLEASYLGG